MVTNTLEKCVWSNNLVELFWTRVPFLQLEMFLFVDGLETKKLEVKSYRTKKLNTGYFMQERELQQYPGGRGGGGMSNEIGHDSGPLVVYHFTSEDILAAVLFPYIFTFRNIM